VSGAELSFFKLTEPATGVKMTNQQGEAKPPVRRGANPRRNAVKNG
jgi:hypothetical protein